ncbi:MAG: ATP-binding protein [Oscillospiraceae bacterium]|nr:ATP-binding protein [Oscillospiraceae bacterium]
MYISRHLEQVVLRANDMFPVLMVTGPRQVGKTTMLEKLAEEGRNYVSLDSRINREMAQSEPELFLQRYPPPVLIDEFQYAQELLPYIKINVDKSKRNGDYWLTGSQMFHMMKHVSESLAGRVAIIPMQGLSNSEIEGVPGGAFTGDPLDWLARVKTRKPQNLQEVYRRIFMGSMPGAHSGNFDRELFFSSYVDTYLQRDIWDLTQVGDEMSFLRFISVCAARTGKQVNYAELAKDVGISAPTAKQWLSILLTTGIVVLLEPYFNNALKRIVKSPKLYFMDTGLCAYLTRWNSAETMEVSAMTGQFFETYAVSEIIKSYYNVGRRPPVFYYRDTDQKEIDLILEADNILYPFEIKKTASPDRSAIRHFETLRRTNKEIGTGGVICLTDSVYPINKENYYVPVWLI